MLSPNSYEGIDAYAANLIRNKARLLVGKAGLSESDRPDLEQELMIDLLERMKRYNPAKAKKTTFMARIVERRIASLLEIDMPLRTCRPDEGDAWTTSPPGHMQNV